ncbi:bifunctional precorrin-2 dehydrogenase/sirohydrochlorin ferrochelatase [Paenibacillus sp.]|uniref:precorrin-2 dehydrogenase/sirohydrochlorin ferrochelatase family protein n=1 Tax=Paenibacillus sp. TaxID=58172 RepID=UPI002D5A48D8|nr:bifunctional precorrin-2 dehydrogenase/sirohydrochlorin ferrochelatase [Paenibacillus sp.]HZG56390.1 bifunctional precorrin-2 dehydrogenase/sirohydrochlorin ferrochelatase [Paenibacillus sp.]
MGEHPKYYPIMADVTDALCVVVGGGPIGWRKIAGLLDCGARVVVVSPDGVPALEAASADGRVVWHRRPFRAGDLAGAQLAFSATNSDAANALVREEARREGVWLNAAYGADEGDFVVPSVVRRGRLVMAVTTGGASPKLARRIAGELESAYGPEYAAYVEVLDRLRKFVLESDAEAERKLICLGRLLEFDGLARLAAGEPAEAVEADCARRLQHILEAPA